MNNDENNEDEELLKELTKDLKLFRKHLEDKKSSKVYALELALNFLNYVLINSHYNKKIHVEINKGISEIIERWKGFGKLK